MKRHNAKLADTTQPPAQSNRGGFSFSPQRKQIMIHVENITINIQAPSAESGPASVLGDALLHAMAESLFAQQSEEELESEGEAQPPINPARMNIMQKREDAWMAVCVVLHEVCPDWIYAPGSAKENAVKAIRAMAKAR